ncbi:hypothetical protein VN1333_12310 [Helicobacter pylori]
MVPADSFDNVKGQFPIGFLVWDTATPPLKPTNAINLEVFDSLGEFLGYKNIVNENENVKNIHTWLKQKEKIENMEILGYIDTPTPDFQGSPSVATSSIIKILLNAIVCISLLLAVIFYLEAYFSPSAIVSKPHGKTTETNFTLPMMMLSKTTASLKTIV